MVDLIVRGGKVVTSEGVVEADLAVAGEVIVEIGPELEETARQEIDARGLYVFPGLIDVHVHFNEPGRESWEGFASGSRALAAGGGTLFFDMPLNASPPTLDARSFLAKRSAAESSSITDFALWAGLTPNDLEHLEELAELGVVGFKAFMCDSGIEDFAAVDDFALYEGMSIAARLGLPVAVHAENESLTKGLTKQLRTEGGKSARDYLRSRPLVAELEAVERAILFARETGVDLHVVHVSSARGVALVAEARAQGVRVTCETCPHYLMFTEDDLERLGAILKCAPPLRSEEEKNRLWQAVLEGKIDLIASDHSPSPPELKEREDFFSVWGGIAGVQSSLQVLFTEGARHGLSLEAVARLTAQNPALRFSLEKKGRLAPGFDADFSLVDLEASYVLEELFSRHPLSPYLGKTFRGAIKQTVIRGKTVFQDGKIIGRRGRFVKRKPA